MRIAQKVAGYSLGQADMLRQAMGKKKAEVLEEEYESFRRACWPTASPRRPSRPCGTPSSRSPGTRSTSRTPPATGWSRTGRRTSRPTTRPSTWPACSPRSATTRTSPRSTWRTAASWASPCCRRTSTSRASTSPPSARTSGTGWVRCATSAPMSLPSIIKARTEKGRFTDFSDYLNKVDIAACNKKVTESLIKAGAFDSLGHPRKGLFLVHTDAVDAVLGTKKAEAMGQFDLFGGRRHRERCGLHHQGARRGVGGQAQTCAGARDAGPVRVRAPAQRRRTSVDHAGRTPRSRRSSTARSPTRRGAGRRHPRVGGPPGEQERDALGVGAMEDLTGGIEVMFFPHDVLHLRDGHRRRRGRAGEARCAFRTTGCR